MNIIQELKSACLTIGSETNCRIDVLPNGTEINITFKMLNDCEPESDPMKSLGELVGANVFRLCGGRIEFKSKDTDGKFFTYHYVVMWS